MIQCVVQSLATMGHTRKSFEHLYSAAVIGLPFMYMNCCQLELLHLCPPLSRGERWELPVLERLVAWHNALSSTTCLGSAHTISICGYLYIGTYVYPGCVQPQQVAHCHCSGMCIMAIHITGSLICWTDIVVGSPGRYLSNRLGLISAYFHMHNLVHQPCSHHLKSKHQAL